MNIVHTPDTSNNIVRWLLLLRKVFTRKSLLDTSITQSNTEPINLPKGFIKSTYEEVDVYSIKTDTDKHFIYLHGGAYRNQILPMHMSFAKHLSKKTKANVHVIDYPLLPTGTVDVTVPQTIACITALMTDLEISSVYLSGDSAGGGLALTIAHQMPPESIEALFLISPWLDVSTTNEGIVHLLKKDPILSVKGLQKCANEYAPGMVKHPLPSPLYNTEELSQQVYIYSGTHDILFPDVLKYEYLHPDVILHVYHKGVHCCSIIPGTQAKKDTLQDIKNNIK